MAFRGFFARASSALAFTLAVGAAAPTPAAMLTYDLGVGCVSATLSGRTIVCNDGTQVALDSSVTPSCPQFALANSGSVYTLVCAVPNATGLWWRPDEDGRGTWLSHQGDTIFAVDYAYDSTGQPRWRTMVAVKRDDGVFAGDVYETRGPSFSAATFDPQAVAPSQIGPGWLVQDDADHVRVNMSEGVARALTRQTFGALPECSFGLTADPATAVNYTDLWWNPGEPGWGINLAHQGDTIFAAWYTYAVDGTPLFLVSTLHKTPTSTYAGDLYRATGPAGATLQATAVGTAILDFVNGNNATLTTNAQLPGMAVAVTRTKGITREIFAAPGAACR
jgi:hypothetical protein